MQYWLMKSEPNDYSIDDLKHDKVAMWDGVRNYQARNFIRDEIKIGDQVLFYHSNAEPPGIAGVAEVVKGAYPDHTAFDPKDPHHDPKSDKENPRWFAVDVAFKKKFKKFISLEQLKSEKALTGMRVTQKGQRLSVQPVEEQHFNHIIKMAKT